MRGGTTGGFFGDVHWAGKPEYRGERTTSPGRPIRYPPCPSPTIWALLQYTALGLKNEIEPPYLTRKERNARANAQAFHSRLSKPCL